jgi:hypothetical protein
MLKIVCSASLAQGGEIGSNIKLEMKNLRYDENCLAPFKGLKLR